MNQLSKQIKEWGLALGFSDIGICDLDLSDASRHLKDWLANQYHGEMAYMGEHGDMRFRPDLLMPGAKSVIMVRIDYLCSEPQFDEALENPQTAFISRYAQNRDYHKIIRKRLAKLAKRIEQEVGPYQHRATADSAPIMEKPLAQKAGLGWIAKSTNLISPKAGSYFFLGCLIVDLELETDHDFEKDHCGSCTRCIDVCPTQAIVAPYQVDARRCISYLTIELRDAIPVEFRKAIGNRIYGCDDCQTCCPWNKFAQTTEEPGFESTRGLKTPDLVELFLWDEETFLRKTEGSAIRRIGHECWLRNIAVALGNGSQLDTVIQALQSRLEHPSAMVVEHVEWALNELNDNLDKPHINRGSDR